MVRKTRAYKKRGTKRRSTRKVRKVHKRKRGGAVPVGSNSNNASMNLNVNANYNNYAVGNVQPAGGWQERAQAVGDFLRDLREGNPGMGYIIDQFDRNYIGPMFCVTILGGIQQEPYHYFHENAQGQPIDPIAFRDALLVEIENLYGLATANQAKNLILDLQDFTFREMQYTVPQNQGGDYPVGVAEEDVDAPLRDTFPQGWAYYEACKGAL